MAYSQELAAAMHLDPQQLEHIRSRQAHLGCEHLLVEFDRRKGTSMAGSTPLSEVTQLKTFQADGKVLLELEGGQQSASGKTMTYTAVTGEVRVIGSPETPAQVMEQDERSGKLNLVRADRDNVLEWNQRTGTIHMTGGTSPPPAADAAWCEKGFSHQHTEVPGWCENPFSHRQGIEPPRRRDAKDCQSVFVAPASAPAVPTGTEAGRYIVIGQPGISRLSGQHARKHTRAWHPGRLERFASIARMGHRRRMVRGGGAPSKFVPSFTSEALPVIASNPN